MLGRDVYSRVDLRRARVAGRRHRGGAAVARSLGLAIGLVTGFVRWLDAIVMRVMDGLMSIPPVLLAIALMALTRASIENVIVAITLAEVPRVVRLVRGLVLTLREQPYVEAAIAAGTSLPRILVRHILPNTLAPLLVQGTFVCASAMITEAILSFIGAGTPPNIPSWGNIMAEGRSLFQVAGYIILFPGHLPVADGAGDQPARRRLARRARPAPRAAACSHGPAAGAAARGRRASRPDFFTRDGIVRAVDGVSFHVDAGRDARRSSASRAAARASPRCRSCAWCASPPGRIVAGAIRFAGRDLLALSRAEMRTIRGNDISMIFQEPMTSLNPVLTIGRQIAETLTLHQRPRPHGGARARGRDAAPGAASRSRERRVDGVSRTSSRAACGSG